MDFGLNECVDNCCCAFCALILHQEAVFSSMIPNLEQSAGIFIKLQRERNIMAARGRGIYPGARVFTFWPPPLLTDWQNQPPRSCLSMDDL